jgi:phage tail sheath gpL-like
MRMIDGVAFTASSDTLANLGTLGLSRNSQFSSIVDATATITPPMELAAGVAGVAAYYGNIDPGRPFTGLVIKGMALAPASALRTNSDRNVLLYDEISTLKASGGLVAIDRLVTTWRTTSAGTSDASYLDVPTMLTLMYLRYSFRARIASAFSRAKLGNDTARVGAGQVVVTPASIKAECVAWFSSMEELGLVEDIEQFKRDLVVERNASDPNRVDILLPPNIINQLMTTAAQIQFRL